MEGSPIFSQKIMTVQSGIRGKYSSDGISSAKNLACEYEDEKRELQNLNENFSHYLERVKQMEARNDNLEKQLKTLRENWGFETVEIRNQKDKELEDRRAAINDAELNKCYPQVQIWSNGYSADILKGKIAFLNLLANDKLRKLNYLENQNMIFFDDANEWTKRTKDLDDDLHKLRKTLDDHISALVESMSDLDNAMLGRMNIENAVQTLKDKLIFLQAIQEEEINELQNISTVGFDTGTFYKHELSKAIDDIRKDFKTLSDAQSEQINSYYKTRIEEIQHHVNQEKKEMAEAKTTGSPEQMNVVSLKTSISEARNDRAELESENSKLLATIKNIEQQLYELQSLRNQEEYDRDVILSKLSDEIQALRNELQNASAGNVSLRFEINTYKRLLEIQEKHLSDSTPSSDLIDSINQQKSMSYSSHGYQSLGGGSSMTAGAVSGSSYREGMDGSGRMGGSYGAGSGGAFVSGSGGSSASSTIHGGDMQSIPSTVYGSYGTTSNIRGASDFSGSTLGFQRSCRTKQYIGSIAIDELDNNDRYIALKNYSDDEVDIGGFAIFQNDEHSSLKYEFANNVRIRPLATLRIFSMSSAQFANQDDLIADGINSWISTSNITTSLISSKGESKAILVMNAEYP
ncbi:hypothetical protein GJ496_005686 [Pomphorhynchus laevis]|nr:hypothetical protein GJ496_005686 [Pomphorhynchus laevis]